MPGSNFWNSLQSLVRGDAQPPRRIGMGMMLHHLAASPGRWSGEIVFDPAVANNQGIVHGGALAAILDVAMGYASLTLLGAGDVQRTLEMKINFLRGVPPDRVLADGEVVREGGQTVYCEGSVRSSDGDLIARGSATFYVRREK